jgi:release factor glutamine methyltransferase
MSEDNWTIIRVLSWTAERFEREGIESPRLDAELLLSHCLGVDRVRLYVDHDKPLQPGELERYRGLVRRRLAREPVAYITETREFWSLSLAVNRHVLVPRPETETLVERALELLDALAELDAPVAVDVGTGSGAVAVALALERPDVRVAAVDLGPKALTLARENARRHGVEVAFYQGDLLEALPSELCASLRLVAANLPYVQSDEIDGLQPEISKWEPRAALDGGADGLDHIRRLVEQSETRAPGAAVALEIGSEQGAGVRALFRTRGYSQVVVHQDLGGRDRVVTALPAGWQR